MEYTWPESFLKGKINYKDTTQGRLMATADALGAWALVIMTGPTKQFGEIMAAIGDFLGIIPTPENLMIESDRLLNLLRNKND